MTGNAGSSELGRERPERASGARAAQVHRLRKSERRERILFELKLRPHVRVSELAERFGVSTETVRRDLEDLSGDGLISRAHGGASAHGQAHFPSFDERSHARLEQRERIGRRAAALVQPGETLMIDSGSTALQLARFLALAGTPCTVLTNSLPVATTLGQGGAAEVILAPGDYLASEAAVIGPETLAFLERHRVCRCLIGASGLMPDGPAESVRGFAAVKRAMLARSETGHLLVDSDKFGRPGLSRVCAPGELASIVVDRRPEGALATALGRAGVEILLADEGQDGATVTKPT